MQSIKQKLDAGIHTIGLPISSSMSIDTLFPKELSGSTIEKMNPDGTWRTKEVVKLENNRFVVSDDYAQFHPFDVVRLNLKRSLFIDWNFYFESHSGIKETKLSYEIGFDLDEALNLAQLSKLVYDKEENIRETIKNQYDFDDYFYYSKNSHRRLINRGFRQMLFAFLRGKMSIVDLQFMYLKKHDEKTGKDLIVVIFQGSQEPHDWLTNFTFKDTDFHQRGKVHQGFYHSLRLFVKTLQQKKIRFKHQSIENPLLDIKKFNENANILIAGHSLGGAIASLMGCYLTELGVKKENIEVYSFGAPPVGSKEFCEYYDKKVTLYRLVNENDVVPKLDKLTSLYHFGEEMVLPSNDGEVHACDGYIDNIIDRQVP